MASETILCDIMNVVPDSDDDDVLISRECALNRGRVKRFRERHHASVSSVLCSNSCEAEFNSDSGVSNGGPAHPLLVHVAGEVSKVDSMAGTGPEEAFLAVA